jgi:biotin-(acetyl-CoA carboxylase) ligase
VTLLTAILREYEAMLSKLGDPRRVSERWQAAAGVPGRRYLVARDGAREPFEGTALALEPGGALRISRGDGTSETVEMADARVLRERR